MASISSLVHGAMVARTEQERHGSLEGEVAPACPHVGPPRVGGGVVWLASDDAGAALGHQFGGGRWRGGSAAVPRGAGAGGALLAARRGMPQLAHRCEWSAPLSPRVCGRRVAG